MTAALEAPRKKAPPQLAPGPRRFTYLALFSAPALADEAPSFPPPADCPPRVYSCSLRVSPRGERARLPGDLRVSAACRKAEAAPCCSPSFLAFP